MQRARRFPQRLINCQRFAWFTRKYDTSLPKSFRRLIDLTLRGAGIGIVCLLAIFNGGVATAQNYTQDAVFPGYHWQPSFANDGQRFAHLLPSGDDGTGFWRDEHGLSTWLQIDFNNAKTIDEVDVYTVGDYLGLLTQADPSATATFTQYGASSFEIDYWTGGAWTAVPGGQITGNNLLWRKVNFAAVMTNKIKVVVHLASDSVARIAEVEAWGTSVAPRTNVAQGANGGVATAQNFTQDAVFPGYHWQPAFANDGQRFAHLLPSGNDGTGFWRDEHGLDSWIQIDFNGSNTIDEVDVFTAGDYPAVLIQADPAPTDIFTHYGAAGFVIQYWNGSAWLGVPGGQITGNNLLWKKVTFAGVTTSKIRVVVNSSSDSVARLTEVEAWTPAAPTNARLDPLNCREERDWISVFHSLITRWQHGSSRVIRFPTTTIVVRRVRGSGSAYP